MDTLTRAEKKRYVSVRIENIEAKNIMCTTSNQGPSCITGVSQWETCGRILTSLVRQSGASCPTSLEGSHGELKGLYIVINTIYYFQHGQ